MTDEDYYDICCVLSLCYRGVEVLSDLDLERILSFDMGWLSPEDAETAVSALIEKGWLIGSRDELTLAGEIEQKDREHREKKDGNAAGHPSPFHATDDQFQQPEITWANEQNEESD